MHDDTAFASKDLGFSLVGYDVIDAGRFSEIELPYLHRFAGIVEVNAEFAVFSIHRLDVDTAPIVAGHDAVSRVFISYRFMDLVIPVAVGVIRFHVFRGVEKFLFHNEEPVACRLIVCDHACGIDNIVLPVVAEHAEAADCAMIGRIEPFT